MTTNIRAIRKQRGLTLQQLADSVGTTPQTIQRLETGNMSVSVDWLQRIAAALELTPAELLAPSPGGQRVRLIGHLIQGGNVHATWPTPIAVSGSNGFAEGAQGQTADHPHVTITSPSANCVALSVKASTGHYAEGTVLVARRQDRDAAIQRNCDCVIGLDTGEMVLRQVSVAPNGTLIYTALDPDADGIAHTRVTWIAPVYMILHDV
jgi:transcriptional regulator with XRE-family HTH domain